MSIVTSHRSTATLLFGKDYHDQFNPQEYLQQRFSSETRQSRLFALKQLHEFYQSYASTSKLKILDIGSGPTIAYTICAAPFAAEIVLSDYTEANRAALLQWLNNDPGAFDWTHIFKHVVVDLEGRRDEEVPVREELVRKVIKAVVPCDVNNDPPVPPQYVDQYDIVTDFLCLVCACGTTEDYVAALVRLHALLKPGGKIVLYTPERKEASTPASYVVGSQQFFDLRLSRDTITSSLKQAGFCDMKAVVVTKQDLQQPMLEEVFAFSFITACKMN